MLLLSEVIIEDEVRLDGLVQVGSKDSAVIAGGYGKVNFIFNETTNLNLIISKSKVIDGILPTANIELCTQIGKLHLGDSNIFLFNLIDHESICRATRFNKKENSMAAIKNSNYIVAIQPKIVLDNLFDTLHDVKIHILAGGLNELCKTRALTVIEANEIYACIGCIRHMTFITAIKIYNPDYKNEIIHGTFIFEKFLEKPFGRSLVNIHFILKKLQLEEINGKPLQHFYIYIGTEYKFALVFLISLDLKITQSDVNGRFKVYIYLYLGVDPAMEVTIAPAATTSLRKQYMNNAMI